MSNLLESNSLLLSHIISGGNGSAANAALPSSGISEEGRGFQGQQESSYPPPSSCQSEEPSSVSKEGKHLCQVVYEKSILFNIQTLKKKVCFLSTAWELIWSPGRPEFIFFFKNIYLSYIFKSENCACSSDSPGDY